MARLDQAFFKARASALSQEFFNDATDYLAMRHFIWQQGLKPLQEALRHVIWQKLAHDMAQDQCKVIFAILSNDMYKDSPDYGSESFF